jgi:DNA polymerase III delta prime subunit
MSENYLFVEKYRPRTIDETILPKKLKADLEDAVKSGTLQHMLFTGTSGVGKTTIARAMCDQLNIDYIFINGSEESGIDTLRTKIKHFASTMSLSGGYKVVIIDEADYLNAQSTQPALRGFMEEFHDNCRFILTCNYKNRIIKSLHSRCATFDFTIPKAEKAVLAGEFFNRAQVILKGEGIKFDKKVLAELITLYHPDWRQVLNELQRYSVSGQIDSGILINLSDDNVKSLMKYLKNKNFKEMRSWVVDNIDMDSVVLFRMVYDGMTTYMKPTSTPTAILILADYQYKAAFVADHELNVVACMTELMANVEWV